MNRYKKTKIASVLGIAGNAFLFVIKLIVGLLSNSMAMLADAFNSGGDIFSSFMTYIGNKIASQPSDDDHNLGHGKAEYIYAMIISIVMLGMALKTFVSSFSSLLNGNEYNFSIWLIIVCLITILVKLCLYLYTSRIAKLYNNVLLKANSKDHFNDTIVTTFTLIATICSIWKIYFVDAIIGMGISLWIAYTALLIFKESYDVLMDKAIDESTKSKVYEIINKHKEVKKVIHFNSTPVGYRYQISFTIYLDGNMSTFESHEIANKLEREIEKNVPEIYLTIIHVNPIKVE